jgi:uncharacterized protein (DUF362 family)
MMHRAFLGKLNELNYLGQFRAGLQYIGFEELCTKESIVFVKPNLTFPSYRRGVMTNPHAIEAAILAIKDYTPHIILGDADSGGYNRFSMDKVYKETGIRPLAEKQGVEVVNLSKLEREKIRFRYRSRDFAIDLPRLLTDEIDLLVTMPVPKVHANTGVSLTFKNQWGCIPEPTDRLRLHPFLQHVVLEVNKAIKAQVAIVDGKYGLNINGPMKGQPVELNWVLVANDIGAGASVVSNLMQIPLESIKHLHYLQENGLIPPLSEIVINRDLTEFRKAKFYLKRKWTDYPGYLAFHSRFLAYLAYFSPIADFLHRVLYLFREPFYDYQGP